MERQITYAPHGHVLTNANVWSHDGQWIVYDVRSDPAGSQFDGTRIERVHVETGEVEVLYESQHGACCGVATFSPADDRVAFILGPEHPTPEWSYSACHRRGVIVDASKPRQLIRLDARDIVAPFTPGALRGGSHVHVFSGDGQWVSFTYEDHVLNDQPAAEGVDFNQRNVGVAAPFGPVRVPTSHPRNHDGTAFCAVVTTTTNCPTPGTDEIDRAYEDAWIGARGYRRADGRWQTRALAFLGDVVAANGTKVTELFIVDVPDDVTQVGAGPLQGTATRRPAPPAGTMQRRLTFTTDRKHPGIQGPRHWPRSSPDGSQIGFLMRDDAGAVQLWLVSPYGGSPRQLTSFAEEVASAFTWNANGSSIALVAGGRVCVVEVATGQSRPIMAPCPVAEAPRPEACVFSPDGSLVAYVREILGPTGRFNQLFVADVVPR